MVTFQGVGYEFGVEMTFPVAESVSAGLLNAVSQVSIVLYSPYHYIGIGDCCTYDISM